MSPQLLQTSTSKASLDNIRRSISSMLQHAMPKLEGAGGRGRGRRDRESKRDKRRDGCGRTDSTRETRGEGLEKGEIERARETRGVGLGKDR